MHANKMILKIKLIILLKKYIWSIDMIFLDSISNRKLRTAKHINEFR